MRTVYNLEKVEEVVNSVDKKTAIDYLNDCIFKVKQYHKALKISEFKQEFERLEELRDSL